MVVPVRGHFVTARRDFSNQLRVMLGDPAEREKRRLDAGLVEEIEQPVGIRRHAAVEGLPGLARHDPLEGGHLVAKSAAAQERRRVHEPGERVERPGPLHGEVEPAHEVEA